jgi:hypothetical protein
VRNLRDEALALVVTLGAVLFTRFWPGLLALWNNTVPVWPGWGVVVPGLFFALVLVAIDASRGTKEQREEVRFPRLVSLVLSGLGVQQLIDQISKMVAGGGGAP